MTIKKLISEYIKRIPAFKKSLNNIVGLLFPITCAGCGKRLENNDYYRVCGKCEASIKKIEGLVCVRCGIPLPHGGEHCYHCIKTKVFHYKYIRSSCSYEELIKELIHEFKYQNKDYLNRILGKIILETIIDLPSIGLIENIIPVPIHWRRRFLRGYNQAELISDIAAKHTGKPCLKNILYRKKYTKPQFALSRKARVKNLAGCFGVKNKEIIKGKTLLLIDDICTTGATLQQCAEILKRSGSGDIYCVTVARD